MRQYDTLLWQPIHQALNKGHGHSSLEQPHIYGGSATTRQQGEHDWRPKQALPKMK